MNKSVRSLLFSECAKIVLLVCYIPKDRDQLWLGVRGITFSMHRWPGRMGFVEFRGRLSNKLSTMRHLMQVEYELKLLTFEIHQLW